MDVTEKALELFRNNFNCAQSVFTAFSEDYGLPRETALKIASGLGGGVRCGEVCGAAAGAVLVIGLKNGHSQLGDTEAKTLCNQETAEFMRRFMERNGNCTCRELLGVDLSKLDPAEAAQKRSTFQTICTDLVSGACETLEDMGY